MKDDTGEDQGGKNMKKLIAILLALTILFSLAACGKKEETAQPSEPSATNEKDTAGFSE